MKPIDKNTKAKGSFLGTGWGFPPTFHKESKLGVEMVSDYQDIKESLHILLNTKIGERLMVEKYGCDLYSFLFESISNSRVHMIKEMLRTAIIRYEPRIKLIKVLIDESEYLDGIIKIKLDYMIPLTNTRFNLVFPYYRVEGTHIPDRFQKQLQKKEDLAKSIKALFHK